MTHEFSDYAGPTGPYIATGEKMLPLDTPEALEAMGHSAMLLSLGASPQADEYERLAGLPHLRTLGSRG
jgi:hypothetical protein